MAENNSKKEKRRFGDRWDGKLLRDIDPMHFTMPMLYPGRCDNEAFVHQVIDLTGLEEYLKKKNEGIEGPRYSAFVIIVAAMLKTLMLRKKMNRFITNKNTYQRNYISASFVIKKHFDDNGDEGLALVYAEEGDTLADIYKKVNEQISIIRSDSYVDESSGAMEVFQKFPRILCKAFVRFVRMLDRHGKVPRSLIGTDPYYSSVVISNLGSIKLKSGYHHLTNWGTNSVFLAIGEKKLRPFYDRQGNMSIKSSIDLGLTIDERLADGYYYSKTIRLLKTLIEQPELLEKPFCENIVF